MISKRGLCLALAVFTSLSSFQLGKAFANEGMESIAVENQITSEIKPTANSYAEGWRKQLAKEKEDRGIFVVILKDNGNPAEAATAFTEKIKTIDTEAEILEAFNTAFAGVVLNASKDAALKLSDLPEVESISKEQSYESLIIPEKKGGRKKRDAAVANIIEKAKAAGITVAIAGGN